MSIIQTFTIPESFQKHSDDDDPGAFAMYRGDLEHTEAPGNKWHKLKYHLQEANKRQATHIATFGGPYSNYLHAFAQTLESSPFKGICVVRGELQPLLTPTLSDAAQCGMELWPSLRRDYKLGLNAEVVRDINQHYPDVYWIPEGGGGLLGAKGCMDWARDIDYLADQYDAWVVCAGTGTTSAGMLAHQSNVDLHVISALKGASSQYADILSLAQDVIKNTAEIEMSHCSSRDVTTTALEQRLFFHSEAHEGGYAKQSKTLLAFIDQCHKANPSLTLDPIYTCKSVYYVMKQWRDGLWPYKRTLFIHTGGLQGWRGYQSKHGYQ